MTKDGQNMNTYIYRHVKSWAQYSRVFFAIFVDKNIIVWVFDDSIGVDDGDRTA